VEVYNNIYIYILPHRAQEKKKAPVPPVKGQPALAEVPMEKPSDDFDFNETTADLNMHRVNEVVDASDALPPQKYRAVAYFIM
jgi:hypothetical protein